MSRRGTIPIIAIGVVVFLGIIGAGGVLIDHVEPDGSRILVWTE